MNGITLLGVRTQFVKKIGTEREGIKQNFITCNKNANLSSFGTSKILGAGHAQLLISGKSQNQNRTKSPKIVRTQKVDSFKCASF